MAQEFPGPSHVVKLSAAEAAEIVRNSPTLPAGVELRNNPDGTADLTVAPFADMRAGGETKPGDVLRGVEDILGQVRG